MADESFVPIEELADHFAVSVSTVRGWIRNNMVPSLKIGGVYRFKISEVEDAFKSVHGNKVEPNPAWKPQQLELELEPKPKQLSLFDPNEDF